ncbi:MAG: SCO family protein, partial [Silvanigrellaceae bacterium]
TPITRRVPQPPPVLGSLPDYSLANPNGTAFGSRELSGKVYVASFIFTRCQSFCPMIVQHLNKLQKRVVLEKLPLTIVSLTVDPDFDTPNVLKAYAETAGADPAVWTFLTGSRESITSLVEKGFSVGMGAPVITNGLIDIAHSQKMALIDGKGQIRGYYDASSEGIDEVFARAEAVVGESLL